MIGVVGLIVAIVMTVWVYQVVDRHGGKLPWLWAAGAFVLWPLLATIAGFKYDETAIAVVGMTGLFIFVAGIGLSALL